MQNVQKVKYVFCPSCGRGQYVIPVVNQSIGDKICDFCGEVFDSTKEEVEPR